MIESALAMPSIQRSNVASEIQDIQTQLAADLAQVNLKLRHELASDVALINQIADYLIGAGGKRLRPMLVLLCERACTELPEASEQSASLAAIVELIHTATLLHDDVVDESDQRRNRKTANALWGNAASVLVGDFLYSRSFQMMVKLAQPDVMAILANTTNAIAEGEVLQLLNKHNAETSEASYLDVIERKTAVLFAAACRLGALSAGASEAIQLACADYGLSLGYAFQIADDVLDYTGDAQAIGKNLGDDLAEGKATLPLIIAKIRASQPDADLITAAIENGQRDALSDMVRIIRVTDALDGSFSVAERYAERARKALDSLPHNNMRKSLLALIDYAIRRKN